MTPVTTPKVGRRKAGKDGGRGEKNTQSKMLKRHSGCWYSQITSRILKKTEKSAPRSADGILEKL